MDTSRIPTKARRPRASLAAARAFAAGFTSTWLVAGADAAHALPIGQDPAGLAVGSLVVLGGALAGLGIVLRRHIARRVRSTPASAASLAAGQGKSTRRALQTPHFFLY